MTDNTVQEVLITGASRGIGLALAKHYAAGGAHVYAVVRSVPKLDVGENVHWICGDLSSREGLAAVIQQAQDAGVLFDVVINNAGIQQAINIAETRPELFMAQASSEIAINLTAPLVLSQALLPRIRTPGGVIANVTSLLSRHPKSGAPVYCASKAALTSFTKAMRMQLKNKGIRVVEIVPPLVATNMTDGRGNGKMEPEAMAAAIVRGIARGKKRIAPGLSGPLLAINRVAPELVASMLAGG